MAKWIEDPQGRLEVEKVTEEIKLPVWKANYKGKFREFWNECWDKIENSFLKLKKSIDGKEAVITKKSGFNLEKTDSFEEDDTNKLATAKALKSLHDEVDRKTGAIKLNWDSIKDKPSSFVPSEHNHNSLYYTETEVDEKLENNILYSTGKTYGGLLNEPGVKSAGKAYWDNNTKKLYICKNNNSDISPNVNNYIPFDNGSILERLENLFRVENKDVTSRVTNCKNAVLKKIKLDRLCIMQFTITSEATASINNKCTIYFDEPFKDIPFISVTDNNAGASGATSPSIDWGTTTQITVSNFEGAFTLMAIGYI